jgi:hypothetical protein
VVEKHIHTLLRSFIDLLLCQQEKNQENNKLDKGNFISCQVSQMFCRPEWSFRTKWNMTAYLSDEDINNDFCVSMQSRHLEAACILANNLFAIVLYPSLRLLSNYPCHPDLLTKKRYLVARYSFFLSFVGPAQLINNYAFVAGIVQVVG